MCLKINATYTTTNKMHKAKTKKKTCNKRYILKDRLPEYSEKNVNDAIHVLR